MYHDITIFNLSDFQHIIPIHIWGGIIKCYPILAQIKMYGSFWVICKSNTKQRALFGLAFNNDKLLVGRGPTGQILVTVARWIAGKFLHFPLLASWPTTKTPGKVSVGKKNITSDGSFRWVGGEFAGVFASSLDNQSRLSSQALTTIEFCLLVKKIFLCLILKRTAFWKETFGVFFVWCSEIWRFGELERWPFCGSLQWFPSLEGEKTSNMRCGWEVGRFGRLRGTKDRLLCFVVTIWFHNININIKKVFDQVPVTS